MIVTAKMKEKIVKVGQKVNFSMSKKLSCLGFTYCTLPPAPPKSGWFWKALLALGYPPN
jgi:hypothetical protein